jgi:alpha-amylase/alpha-mannosidase (GH57 family)
MPGKIHVIIHGHFYQPPRENPWSGRIERQPSAAPFHDWNERITRECYAPNTHSRIQNDRGRLVEVVNNFEHISFNFGPTLLSYLESEHPDTYRRILQADQASIDTRGYGNAMAQCYNHMIMPLASARDRWTQIQWGLADFRARFRREPSGMWLPETAVNEDTLCDLVKAGIEFILLSPSQAEAYRRLDGGSWRDGPPPSDRPYLCRTPAGEIDILFYHAGLSSAVAFEHLLRNAAIFADRIAQAARESDLDEDRLVFVCSDGESYGHHEKLGDMCLAYLAAHELPARDMVMTSPRCYLAGHRPEFEVRLKPGREGQGTAWSCAHGVDRWQADCGCSDGGRPGWNQAWRGPLRHAFDELRAKIDLLFEGRGLEYLNNPWMARDDYIKVVLGKPLGAARAFFSEHLRSDAPSEARAAVFRLMEMQRNAMLMYTSCGWFFADLAGLEAVQNMRYAARAAELGKLVAGAAQDSAMRIWLDRAQSNLPGEGSGLSILNRRVLPESLPPAKAAARYAVLSMLHADQERDCSCGYRIEVHERKNTARSGFESGIFRLTVVAEKTQEGGTFDAAVLIGSGLRMGVFINSANTGLNLQDPERILSNLERDGFDRACERLEEKSEHYFGLKNLSPQTRESVVGALLDPLLDELGRSYEEVFTGNEWLVDALVPLGIALPAPLRPAIGWAGSARFNSLVERGLNDANLERAAELAGRLSVLNVPLEMQAATGRVSQRLEELLEEILDKQRVERVSAFMSLLSDARRIGLGIDEAALQVKLGLGLGGLIAGLLDPLRQDGPAPDTARAVIEMADLLNLDIQTVRLMMNGG